MSLEKLYPVNLDLIEMTERIDQALESSMGEITPEIQQMIDDVATINTVNDMANYWHRLDAKARAKEAELRPIIEALEAEIKLAQQQRDRVKSYVGFAVRPGKSLITDDAAIWYRESTAVDIIDPDAIPIEYTRVKTEPDKRAVAQALKEGKEVRGAQLVINYSLQIDHPGEKAKKNAKTREKNRAKKTVDLLTALEG